MRKLRILDHPIAHVMPAILGLLLYAPAHAATVTINFETLPALPTQPNNFFAAGAMQTYSSPGQFTISGGVVLGNPTFLAAFAAHGSTPNAYGTADFADPSLQSSITLALPSSEDVTNVSAVVFNGQSFSEAYQISARSGATALPLTNVTLPQGTSTSDFFNYSLSSTAALPITQVTFTTPNAAANGWDFFVDTIVLTTGAVTTIPEPATTILLSAGLAALVYLRRRYSGS